jgi:hypothetical protein
VFRSDFSEAETPVVDLRRIIEDNVPYVISFDFTNPRNLVIA